MRTVEKKTMELRPSAMITAPAEATTNPAMGCTVNTWYSCGYRMLPNERTCRF